MGLVDDPSKGVVILLKDILFTTYKPGLGCEFISFLKALRILFTGQDIRRI